MGCGDHQRGRHIPDTLGDSTIRGFRNTVSKRSVSCSRLLNSNNHPRFSQHLPIFCTNDKDSSIPLYDGTSPAPDRESRRTSRKHSSFLPFRKNCLIRRVLSCNSDKKRSFDTETTYYRDDGKKIPDWLRPLVVHILGTLEENQLKLLHSILDIQGAELGECILVNKEETVVPSLNFTVGSHLLMTLYFRWAIFPFSEQLPRLRKLPCCPNNEDSFLICINPYHWGILFIPGRISI